MLLDAEHLVTLTAAAARLGIARDTLAAAIEAGCPADRVPGRGPARHERRVDPVAAARWLRDRDHAVELARPSSGTLAS